MRSLGSLALVGLAVSLVVVVAVSAADKKRGKLDMEDESGFEDDFEQMPAASNGGSVLGGILSNLANGDATGESTNNDNKPAASSKLSTEKLGKDAGDKLGQPSALANLHQAPKGQATGIDGLKQVALQGPGPSPLPVDQIPGATSDLVTKQPFDLKRLNLQEWVKFIFNPLELARKICDHFNLPYEKTMERLGQNVASGLEPMLYPLVYSVKIVERLFQPDQCRLKFACSMGHHLAFVRDNVLKFSPNFLEGSSHLKALSEGIAGHDCQAIFPDCEPKLKKPFEDLKATTNTKG